MWMEVGFPERAEGQYFKNSFHLKLVLVDKNNIFIYFE